MNGANRTSLVVGMNEVQPTFGAAGDPPVCLRYNFRDTKQSGF